MVEKFEVESGCPLNVKGNLTVHIDFWKSIGAPKALGTLEIIDRRVTKILNTIDQIIDADYVISARRLASFAGQIFSTGPVVGNIARIMTRHCVMSTLCNDHWDLEFRLDDYCKEELYFWKENLINLFTVDIAL